MDTAVSLLEKPLLTTTDVTDTLAQAFYYQDARMDALLQGDYVQAQYFEQQAGALMALAYAFEFPRVPFEQARQAGALFMHALFMQDEIENWPALSAAHADCDLLVIGSPATPPATVLEDSRWEDVQRVLADVCTLAGIPQDYAHDHAEFWRLHGQKARHWEQWAHAAHVIKLSAMIPDSDANLCKKLADHFVNGVQVHDRWEHKDLEAETQRLHHIVLSYYNTISDERSYAWRDYVQLVTPDDQPIRAEKKLAAHEDGGSLHRAFSVFLYNSDGEVLMQQRALGKYHCPGQWSNTCCSHPAPGTDVLRDAEIRLMQELNLSTPLQHIGTCRYEVAVGNELTEHELDHILVGELSASACPNTSFTPNPAEVAELQWIPLQTLESELAANPERFTPWLSKILPAFKQWYATQV